ncbi:MAG TPA: exodeoxyribonuclease V subunit beta [Candidatus Paceibacterota bacterium]|nr:exodeoxyribonuclease V subunit beta [Verrucomicrobiota bacterium]HSA09352.1 exodeoxyribonuclease V subunit beta [Candidatus Paceibacterota bacterium]
MKAPPVFRLAETELRAGTSLIEASAGTGKTFTIAGLFLRLILERDLSVNQILVVTYTVAATEELRNRVRQLLARAREAFMTGASEDAFLKALLQQHAAQAKNLAARLTTALDGFDEAPIYTIHGFCQRVLKDRAFETGSLFDTELVTDPVPLLRQLVEDYWRKQFYRADRLPVLFALKNKLSPEALLPLVRECLPHPALKLLPDPEALTPAAVAAELEGVFSSLRETWRKEKDAIRSHFGSGARWANQPYNKERAMADAFRQIEHCLGAPGFPVAALDALLRFRKSAIAGNVSRKVKGAVAPEHRFFDQCEQLAAAEKRYVIALRLGAFRYVEQELPQRKDELKIQFYDDLLRNVHRALAGEHGQRLATILRSQYAAALIDEFQDTDPLQYEIFRRVFATPEHQLFLIGDPKQAIYGFRGADIFTYLEASRQASQTYTLKENWRSESGLVRAVNTVFGESPQPFVFDDIGFHAVEARGEADKHPLKVDGERQPALRFWFCRRDEKPITMETAKVRLPAVVASEIVALLNGPARVGDRDLLPQDIAVLVPTNRQAELLQQALGRLKIPSVLHTTASLFASREVAEMQRVLAAIANPTRESELLVALGTDLLGYTGAQLETLVRQEAQWQDILERFRGYLDLWLRRGFIQMFRSFMQREQVRPRLLAFPNGERRLTNLLHLAEVLHQASLERRLGVAGLLKWIAEQREVKDQASEEHQLRLETDERAVRLVTIHKSKGLEYNVVFCPFSWKDKDIEHHGEDQVLYHEQGDGRLTRDLDSPEYDAHRQSALVERLAENVRLLYVALTRARHRCYFVWGAFNGAGTSAPVRLLHPPPTNQPNVVSAQEQHYKNLSDEQLLADLRQRVDQSVGPEDGPAIEVQDLPEPAETPLAAPVSTAPALTCRKFTGAIARDWRISSFTSLTANQDEERPDHDELGAQGRDGPPGRPESIASGIFAFPGGAKPGTCLHKILEQLDFTQWNQPATHELVRDQLQAHGLPAAEFSDIIVEMLGRVLTVPLDEKVAGLTLAKLSTGQRLQELEFHCPLGRISPETLRPLLREHRFAGAKDPGIEPEGFSFTPVRGMLKGFIDLVFEFGGRFYVLDWKSNHLGNRVEDYAAAALADEVRRRHYCFQYQLYTAALDRYLRLRLPGYSYEKHFGGVYYLFLRGIDPARPGFGIHRDRLKESFVRKLNGLLTSGAGGSTA